MRKVKAPEAGLPDHERMPVGKASLAHQGAGNRDIQEFSKRSKLFGGLRKQHTAARVDHRTLCFHKALCDFPHSGRSKRGLDGAVAVTIGARKQVGINLAGEHVHRHVDQHRARAAAFRKAEGLVEDFRQRFRIVNAPGALYDWTEDFILGAIRMHIHFLMGMLAEIIARHITRDEHEWDGIKRRIGNAGYGVGDAGAKVRKDNGGLMLYAGITVRRGCGDLLMAHRDILNLLAAGERIQKPMTVCPQRPKMYSTPRRSR